MFNKADFKTVLLTVLSTTLAIVIVAPFVVKMSQPKKA